MTHETLESIAGMLPNGSAPLDGVVTAGQLNAAHVRQLKDAGITSVVDLRAPNEPRDFDEAAAFRAEGIEYHNIPVVQGLLGPREFDDMRALLRSTDKRPMVVHCGSANRVGALLIPYLVLDENRTPEEALRIARDVGLRSAPLAETALAYVRDRASGSPTR